MKNRSLSIILFGVVVFLSVGLLFALNKQVSTQRNAQSKYILVKDAQMMGSGIIRPNAAILISDQELIEQDENLFLGNHAYSHACGYHYTIQFWESSDKLIEEFSYNKECEEFASNNKAIQDKMKEYIHTLETQPTHYIYNLKIPVSTDPSLVKKAFESSNMPIFFLQGTTEHLLSLTITYSKVTAHQKSEDKRNWDKEIEANEEKTRAELTAIVNQIREVADVKHQSEISFPHASFGATIEHLAQITLKFPNGYDLTKVKEIVALGGGECSGEKNPAFYFVQLVDGSNNIDVVREMVKDYQFVDAVYEYPATQ